MPPRSATRRVRGVGRGATKEAEVQGDFHGVKKRPHTYGYQAELLGQSEQHECELASTREQQGKAYSLLQERRKREQWQRKKYEGVEEAEIGE